MKWKAPRRLCALHEIHGHAAKELGLAVVTSRGPGGSGIGCITCRMRFHLDLGRWVRSADCRRTESAVEKLEVLVLEGSHGLIWIG